MADTLVLGALLEEVRTRFGRDELLDHWKQGEFHHDVVVRVPGPDASVLPGTILVVATNCNGGVKEVLSFAAVPDRWALWHWRCPQVNDFSAMSELAKWLDQHGIGHRREDPKDVLGVSNYGQ